MRPLLLSSAILLSTIGFITPSKSVIVECANCSSLFEQLKSDAMQLQQKIMQLQQYQLQFQQYQNMIRNTVALPQQVWGNVSGDIMQVRNITNAASLLTGSNGSIMTRLSNAQGYANQAISMPANFGGQLTMWQQNLGNASNSLGRTLGLQQQQMQNDALVQQRIQAQSASAIGQMQAIQAGNEMAALTSTQLNEMQTTLTAMAQETATKDLNEADRSAEQDAALQIMLQGNNVNTTGYRGY